MSRWGGGARWLGNEPKVVLFVEGVQVEEEPRWLLYFGGEIHF